MLLNFDATNVPQADVLDPIPAGWYNCAMDESEMKPTKTGNGQYLSCRFTILDGLYVGRKVYMRFNLQNENPVAQEIGWKQLSSFCHSVGRLRVQDSQELHGLPVKVKVKLKAAEGSYEASNDVTGFKNINEQTGPAHAGAPGFPGAGGPAWAGQPQFQPPQQPQFQPPQQPQFQPPQPPQPAAWTPGGAAAVQQAGAVAQQTWAQPQQEQQAAQPAQQVTQPAWAAAPAQPWAAPQQAPAAAQQQPAAAPPPASAAQSAPPPWVAQAPGAAATPPWVQPAQ